MKNIIEYGSLNVHPGTFSLDKFIESDAPGTLSWLNIEANDLDIDIPPFNEVELSLMLPLCPAAKLNKQGIPCQHRCAGCRSQQVESSEKMEFHDMSNPK